MQIIILKIGRARAIGFYFGDEIFLSLPQHLDILPGGTVRLVGG
ncbi:hypothetical protein BH09BAC3_BH09BAC3_09670 [soil metagenome]